MAVEIDYENKIRMLENQLEFMMEERLAELELAREDDGWVRLNGEADIEFSLDHLKNIIARSRLFFLSNPLIRRAVSLQSDYVFAQGLNIQATSDLVNKVVQDFMDDRMNIREITGHAARLLKEQTLMIDGNVFLVLFTDKSGFGTVQVRSILVDEIVDIITNPDDQNEIWFYKRQWISKLANGTTKINTVFYPDFDYNPVGVKPKTKNKIPIIWDAPIYHVKVGALAKSRYGVPETYPAIPWAKAQQEFLQNWATIVKAYARFAFKFTSSGNRQSIVAAKTRLGTTVSSTGNAVETNPSPTVASMFARRKDGDDIEPIKTAGATTGAQDGRELLLMIASAMGVPINFFGLIDSGNLATARTLDRPTELKFRSRQELWTAVFTDIINYTIKWAIMAPRGSLNKYAKFKIDSKGNLTFVPGKDPETQKDIDIHIEVVFPPILEHSIQDRIDAVTNAVTLNGKTFVLNSPELTKLTMRLMFQALGLNDVDELVDDIFNNLPKQLDPNAIAIDKGGVTTGKDGGGNQGNPSDASKDNDASNAQK